MADVIDDVLAREGRIDLLKIDTEGSEPALVASLRPDQWERIGSVVYELPEGVSSRTGAAMRQDMGGNAADKL